MSEYWDKVDAWEKASRQEFKDSEWYEEGIGENFTITSNGDVHLNNFHVIRKAVTPFDE